MGFERASATASLARHATEFHPLQLSIGRHVKEIVTNEDTQFDDPLRGSPVHELPDEQAVSSTKIRPAKRVRCILDEQLENATVEWDSFKQSLLQKFASSGNITVSSMLGVRPKEKVRGLSHLQKLDDPNLESKEEKTILTQQEYIAKLKELKQEIAEAWASNERVTALRMAVKIARLLSDTSVPQFYPTLFVLVTDALDTVGDLVWDRIKLKAELNDDDGTARSLPVNFSANDVRQDAKDTCTNWFLKISSIKELLPRVYLEIAILRCTRFLEEDPPISTVQRLSVMIRGLGEPLASAYAHIYLSRKGLGLIPREIGYLINGIQDFSLLFQKAGLGTKQATKSALVEPMFEWTVALIFKHLQQEDIPDVVVALCGKNQERASKPLSVLIHYMIKQLPSVFIGNHATEMTRLVKSFSDASMPQHMTYISLGKKFYDCPPPREYRIQILNDVWMVISKYGSLVEYLAVAEAFVEYILQYCSETELLAFLIDIRKRLDLHIDNLQVFSFVETIVIKLLAHYTDLDYLLALESFVEIVDMLHGDIRTNVYKFALSSASKRGTSIQDSVTRHFCLKGAKVLHDSLDSLSSDDDRRQFTRLIARYVQLARFGKDLEQHLDFLVECRASFSSMDSIKEEIVHISNRLTMTTLKLAKGCHSQQSMDYVKACITFNEITVPSITSIVLRTQLFLETAEVALMNGLLSHSESLVRSGIMCLQEIPMEGDRALDDELARIFQNLCSFLIVLPGDPELGALYLVRGLFNLVDSKPGMFSERKRLQVLCGFLLAASALSQERLPYHVDQIESNDSLYYGDLSYQDEVSSFADAVHERISRTADREIKPEDALLLFHNGALRI